MEEAAIGYTGGGAYGGDACLLEAMLEEVSARGGQDPLPRAVALIAIGSRFHAPSIAAWQRYGHWSYTAAHVACPEFRSRVPLRSTGKARRGKAGEGGEQGKERKGKERGKGKAGEGTQGREGREVVERAKEWPAPAKRRGRRASVAAKDADVVDVEVVVAEELLADARALHEQADVELVGHADAAVHLHRLLDGESAGGPGPRLGDGDVLGGAGRVLVEPRQGLGDRRPGELDLAVQVRGPMLQRLEFADELAELLALRQVGDGSGEDLVGDAEHLGRERRPTGVQRAAERP